jgi:phosphoglycerol transferase MdoB-like AlkP superfamily enzyme
LVLGIIFIINPVDINIIDLLGQNTLTVQLQLLLSFGMLSPWILFISAIVLIPFALLDFFIARGLRRKKKWTRVIVIIFSILGILSGLGSLLSKSFVIGAFFLILNVLILVLIFNKKVKEAFS